MYERALAPCVEGAYVHGDFRRVLNLFGRDPMLFVWNVPKGSKGNFGPVALVIRLMHIHGLIAGLAVGESKVKLRCWRFFSGSEEDLSVLGASVEDILVNTVTELRWEFKERAVLLIVHAWWMLGLC